MDTSGILDTVERDDVPASTPVLDAPHADASDRTVDRSVHRFAFDPASSPAMMAAFACNTAGPTR